MSRTITGRQALVGALALAVAATGAVTTNAASAATPAVKDISAKASPARVSATAGQTITLTGSGFLKANGTPAVSAGKVVTGTAPKCSDAGTALGATDYTIVTDKRITLTTQSVTLPTAALSVKGLVCFPLLADATKYAVAAVVFAKQPVADTGKPLAPVAGAMAGGGLIWGYSEPTAPFQPGATIVVNGVPSSKTNVSKDGLSIAAFAPQSSVATTDSEVVVRTPGFSDVILTPTTKYSYKRAVTVAPQVAAPLTATPLVVKGAGFKGITYTDTGKSFNIFLVNAAGTADECDGARVVSDTEATCEVPVTAVAGIYTVVVSAVSSYSAADLDNTVLSRGAVLTLADF